MSIHQLSAGTEATEWEVLVHLSPCIPLSAGGVVGGTSRSQFCRSINKYSVRVPSTEDDQPSERCDSDETFNASRIGNSFKSSSMETFVGFVPDSYQY